MTKTPQVPEIILGAKQHSIDKKIDLITAFLSPIHSEESEKLIQDAKNLQALAEFFEGASYDELMLKMDVLNKLSDYNLDAYINFLESTDLKLHQRIVLANLATVHYNARGLAFRTYAEENEIQKEIHEYAKEVMETVMVMMEILDKKMPSEQFCKTFYPKTCQLNGTLIQYIELGF